jgi:hypothetical protein
LIRLLLLPAFLFLVFYGQPWLIGWAFLFREYKSRGAPPANLRRFRAVQVGRWTWLMSRSMMLSVGWSDRGLYIAMIPRFIPGYPPLFIPWSAIEYQSANRGWFRDTELFEVRAGSRIVLLKVTPGLIPLPADRARSASTARGDPPRTRRRPPSSAAEAAPPSSRSCTPSCRNC